MESLGNYSFYSFYGSLLSPRELAELAYHLGYRTVGVADEGGFWGAVKFSQACRRMGLRPLRFDQFARLVEGVVDQRGRIDSHGMVNGGQHLGGVNRIPRATAPSSTSTPFVTI